MPCLTSIEPIKNAVMLLIRSGMAKAFNEATIPKAWAPVWGVVWAPVWGLVWAHQGGLESG